MGSRKYLRGNAIPPRCLAAKYQPYEPVPANTAGYPRRAIAVDCEMGSGRYGSNELILICVVDFLTGEILINKLVGPSSRIFDWRTRYSGVRREHMIRAEMIGDTLNGWRGARAELWKYMDENTVLIGHSLNNDLDAIKLAHHNIVDSSILAENAVGIGPKWGLKRMCKQLLNINIQTGKKGHDCVEDTLAARELVLWCMRNPQRFTDWSTAARLKAIEAMEAMKSTGVKTEEGEEKEVEAEVTKDGDGG